MTLAGFARCSLVLFAMRWEMLAGIGTSCEVFYSFDMLSRRGRFVLWV
jgi:hypothetical protein